MDAYDQLLLSEVVCHQLGIIQYHPAVRAWTERRRGPGIEVGQKSDTEVDAGEAEDLEDRSTSIVPTVRVKLLQTVTILPHQRTMAMVKMVGDTTSSQSLLLHPTAAILQGVSLDAGLLHTKDGIACLELANHSGYTQHLAEGTELGEAMEAEVVTSEDLSYESLQVRELATEEGESIVKQIHPTRSDSWRKEEISRIFLSEGKLPNEEGETICELLMHYHHAFSLEEGERGETQLVQLEIDMRSSQPIKPQPRRMPFAVREEVSKQLRKMQQAGMIQPSKSSWASPVVLVKKRDGSHRFCLDYRALNTVTKQDTFPLPRVDDLLDQLGKTRYLSSLDLASGYWQIRVHPESQPKTAFVTHQGLHEFKVMPFGLTNAPSVFQRLMQQVLMGLNPDDAPDFVSVYIDNIS